MGVFYHRPGDSSTMGPLHFTKLKNHFYFISLEPLKKILFQSIPHHPMVSIASLLCLPPLLCPPVSYNASSFSTSHIVPCMVLSVKPLLIIYAYNIKIFCMLTGGLTLSMIAVDQKVICNSLGAGGPWLTFKRLCVRI